MEKELLQKLKSLKNEEHELKRILDGNYHNLEIRTNTFNKIKQLKKEISKIEFKIKLERELKNANNNNTKSSN